MTEIEFESVCRAFIFELENKQDAIRQLLNDVKSKAVTLEESKPYFDRIHHSDRICTKLHELLVCIQHQKLFEKDHPEHKT